VTIFCRMLTTACCLAIGIGRGAARILFREGDFISSLCSDETFNVLWLIIARDGLCELTKLFWSDVRDERCSHSLL